MTTPATSLSLPYRRDLAAIERAAKEVLVQVGHLRRNTANGDDDRLRFANFEAIGQRLAKAGKRASRRYYRERGWA